MIIRVHNPNGTIQEFPLQAPNELRFGSHPSLEITLAGTSVGKLLGGFVFKKGKPCVVAAKPTEKIELNGKLVSRAFIRTGDRIRVGGFELEISQPASTEGGKASSSTVNQQDDLRLDPEIDDLGLAPEPAAKQANSQSTDAAQIDELELLDDATRETVTEDLEVLDDFEELTETEAAATTAEPSSRDAVPELDDVETLDEMEMLAEAPGDAETGDADWLQSGDLLADSPATADDLTSGDLFGDVANLPGTEMAAPGGVAATVPGATAPAGVAPKEEKQPRVKKKRNYGPLKYIAVAFAAISLLVIVIAASMLGPAPKDQFAAADQLFQSQQLAEADQAFAKFRQDYPSSIYTDEARVKRGVIKLLPLIDSQAELSTRFATVRQVLNELDDLDSHPLVQEQLGKIVPTLAKGLGEEVLAMPVTAGLEKRDAALSQANQALRLTRQSMPPSEFASQDLGNLEIRLFLLDREISETKDFEIAAAEIEGAVESSQFALGLEVYHRLLDDHAALAESPVLLNLMQRLSVGMSGEVDFVKESLPTGGEPSFKTLPAISFAPREQSASAGQAQPVFVFDAPSACVYCLDATSGALLWRKFIGFDAAFDPLVGTSQAGEVVLQNTAAGTIEKLDGMTGEVIWSKPIGAKQMWLARGKSGVYVSTVDGELWELDLADGESKRKINFPQPLGLAAYVDDAGGKLFQPLLAASLFAVALDQDSCEGASFVGHPAQALRFPPADLGDYLVVVEDAGLDRSTLKLIAKKGRSQLIQSIPLGARAAGVPLAQGKLVLVPTDDGRLMVYGIDDQKSSQPMSLKSEVKWAEATLPIGQAVWLKSVDGTVFQAGHGMQVFRRRGSTDEFVLSSQLFPGLELIQPVQEFDGIAVVAYRDSHGVTVEGLNAQDLSQVWKTRVARRLLDGGAATPSVDAGSVVVSADIAKFEFTEQQLTATQNQVVIVQAGKPNTGSKEPHLINSPRGEFQMVAMSGEQNLYLFSPEQAAANEIKLPNQVAGKPAATSAGAVIPLQDGRTILVDWNSGAIVGKPSIRKSRSARWVATCAINDNRFASADSDGNLQIYQVDQASSLQVELLAEKKLDAPITSRIVASGELIFLAIDQRKLTGMDAESLEQEFAVDLDGPLMFGPCVAGDYLVVATNRQIICFSAEGGDQLWQQSLTGRRIVGVATGGNDRLILASAAGEIWSVDPKTGESNSKLIETGEAFHSIFASGREIVYLQSMDGSILLLKISELTASE